MNAPAAINRESRIPATNEITQCRLSVRLFDPAPFCAAPIPNQKRSLSIAVSAVTGAALWRPYYAYDYGELAYGERQVPKSGPGIPRSTAPRTVAPGLTAPPTWTPGLIAPPTWAGSAVGIMRIAATTPIIESLPSIRLLLAQYPFNSLHDWHFEILFIIAIFLHLVHFFLKRLYVKNPVVAFGMIVTAYPSSEVKRVGNFSRAGHEFITSDLCNIDVGRPGIG